MALRKNHCCTLLLIIGFQLINHFAASQTLNSPYTDSLHKKTIDSSKTDAFLEELLQQYPQYFDSILANRKAMNVQWIYTKIDRGANGIAALKSFYFNVDSTKYFYPAGATALPISLLVLQKMAELKNSGIDKNSTMLTENSYGTQTAALNDPTTIDGKPTLANYLKRMLLINDAAAHDRLYEFAGQQYINDQLRKKGYPKAAIIQRLTQPVSEEENRHTNPIKFLSPWGKLIYQQPQQYNTTKFPLRNDSLGKGYYAGEKIIDSPMDFSSYNRMSLEELNTVLISLIFPNKVTAAQRFNIAEEDRKFILKYMSQLPTESNHPPYADEEGRFYPSYNKYLWKGAKKDSSQKSLRSFNVTGKGYGQLLDVAYFVDFDKKIEFFLAAVIDCNSDGILNDDKYDYDTIGLPFLQHLGQVMYEYEAKREKAILPELNEFIFEYDIK